MKHRFFNTRNVGDRLLEFDDSRFMNSLTTKLIRYFQGIILFVLGAMTVGCSTVHPGKHFSNVPIESLKSAYIVLAPSTDHKLGEYIHEALSSHNVAASMGPSDKKPADVSFYVTYEDHWKWDLAMYLWSLDIRFSDTTNGQTIASGSFTQGAFHSFPNPRLKTIEVVESIYRTK